MGKVMVEFSDNELDEILDYMKTNEYDTIQEAVIEAIRKGYVDDD